MTDYIKREDAYSACCYETPECYMARKEIKALPSADVVPVVYCGDCVWWTQQEASCQGRCARLGIYPTGAWYCANGAKMDGGDADEID